jgi:hypothetical protein
MDTLRSAADVAPLEGSLFNAFKSGVLSRHGVDPSCFLATPY